MRDFEVGRLPTPTTRWLAPLLDQKLVHVEGKVIDCKIPLEKVGDEITLLLSVWLRPEAFVQVRRPLVKENSEQRVAWGSLVKETEDEEKMSRRKAGLNTLFETLNVKPLVGSAISAEGKINSQPGSPESSRAGAAKASAKGKEREVAVMEDLGENEDEEEGTAIEHKDIDLIYAKCVSRSPSSARNASLTARLPAAEPSATTRISPRWTRRAPLPSPCAPIRSRR